MTRAVLCDTRRAVRQASAIIGARGQHIRSVEEATGARVQVQGRYMLLLFCCLCFAWTSIACVQVHALLCTRPLFLVFASTSIPCPLCARARVRCCADVVACVCCSGSLASSGVSRLVWLSSEVSPCLTWVADREQVLNREHRDKLPARFGLPDLDKLFANLGPEETIVVIKGTEAQRKAARTLLNKMIEPEEADDALPLTPEESSILTRLRGAVRRDIEDATGARLMLNDANDSLVVYGKADERAAARAALASEFALKEEARPVGGAFPLLMLRLLVGTGGVNVRRLEAESGARIRFDTVGDGPEASVSVVVRGSPEQRKEALELVAKLELEYQEERMPLEQRKHYLLIGRGGDVVKQLESKSNTAICFTLVGLPLVVRVLSLSLSCRSLRALLPCCTMPRHTHAVAHATS